jgi:hypothetical protein
MAIVLRYFDAQHVRPKMRFALEELLAPPAPGVTTS